MQSSTIKTSLEDVFCSSVYYRHTVAVKRNLKQMIITCLLMKHAALKNYNSMILIIISGDISKWDFWIVSE